jgi:uncharacterized membrane protein
VPARRDHAGAARERQAARGTYNAQMLALRYIYVLALVIWLGGMILLGAIVAPTTFQVLQASSPEHGRALAGELFGALLARFHYVAYAAGAVLLVTLAAMAVLGPRPAHFAVRSAIIGVMLIVALYSGLIVLREVATLQEQIGALPSTLPATDLRRIRFDALHQLATRLMMFNMVAALVLLYWEARE